MNQFLYHIVTFIARLPFAILYRISDVLFFLLYYIIGYRKKVVFENLKNSFPEKSNQELKQIQKRFFKNFSDFLVETIKGFSITQEEAKSSITFENIDLFQKSYNEKKNVILMAGHNFNWEFANIAFDSIPQDHFYAIYRNLQNPFWDEKVISSREKFGAKLIEAKVVMRHIASAENNGNSIFTFLADQTPHHSRIQQGIMFLNQKTPIFNGYDRIANKDNMNVIYAETTKIKRGKYHIKFIEILPEKETFQPDELIIKFHKTLENTIINNPANWLWTHKRWKYAHYLTDEMMIK